MLYFSLQDTEVAPGNDGGSQFCQDFGTEGGKVLTGKFYKSVCGFSPTKTCGVFLQLPHALLLSVLRGFLAQQGDK